MPRRAIGFLLACATGLMLVTHVGARATPSITDLLDWYDHDRYDDVTADLARRNVQFEHDRTLQGVIDPLLLDLDGAARKWILAGGKDVSDHRRLVAATLALEISHSRTDPSLTSRAPFLVWACDQLRKNPPRERTYAERLWYIASVAAFEEINGWSVLMPPPGASVRNAPTGGGLPLPPGVRSPIDVAIAGDGPAGHLAHAHARFPDEPRFMLALVEGRDRQTLGIGGMLRRDVLSNWQLRSAEISPETIASLRERAAGALDPKDRSNAASTLALVELLPEIGRAYAALAEHDEIRAEVELRFGYVAARTWNWDSAIEHLSVVPTVTHDSTLLYLSHYIRGWALQREGSRAEAVDAYRQALAIVPHVRTSTTLLADQLFLSDRAADRAEAYALMDAINHDGHTLDPWVLYSQGDARLLPDFIATLREALK